MGKVPVGRSAVKEESGGVPVRRRGPYYLRDLNRTAPVSRSTLYRQIRRDAGLSATTATQPPSSRTYTVHTESRHSSTSGVESGVSQQGSASPSASPEGSGLSSPVSSTSSEDSSSVVSSDSEASGDGVDAEDKPSTCPTIAGSHGAPQRGRNSRGVGVQGARRRLAFGQMDKRTAALGLLNRMQERLVAIDRKLDYILAMMWRQQQAQAQAQAQAAWGQPGMYYRRY